MKRATENNKNNKRLKKQKFDLYTYLLEYRISRNWVAMLVPERANSIGSQGENVIDLSEFDCLVN